MTSLAIQRALDSMDERAGEVMARITRADRALRPEHRERYLRELVFVTPKQARDTSPEGRSFVIDRLRRALTAEERRAGTAHWTYDLNRHVALRQMLGAEVWRAKEASR